jgi:UDP-glucose 4-epimerase
MHLAARPSVPRSVADPMASHEVNATGTLQVLEAARAAGRAPGDRGLVVVGVRRQPAPAKHEDLHPRPMSPYAASKLATESYALAWAHQLRDAVLAFRFFNVFGPLQPAGHAYAAVVPAFVDAALRGRAPPVHGDGSQSRDFTFVDTVAPPSPMPSPTDARCDGPVNLAFGTRTPCSVR